MADFDAKDLTQALRNQIDLLGSANRALEKQSENLHRRVEHLREELREKAQESEDFRALVRKLAEELDFYGDSENYRDQGEGKIPVLRDKGTNARRALSHLKEWSQND